MFAYRTTSLSKSITSDLYALAKLSERRFTEPSQRATQSLSQTFTLTVPIRWKDSILIHHQEMAQNTSLFDPPTPARSIIILFDLINRVFIKNTHLTLYQVIFILLTPSFSCPTNTRFLYTIYSFLCVPRSANQAFDRFYNVLICKSLWIKASTKCIYNINPNM